MTQRGYLLITCSVILFFLLIALGLRCAQQHTAAEQRECVERGGKVGPGPGGYWVCEMPDGRKVSPPCL